MASGGITTNGRIMPKPAPRLPYPELHHLRERHARRRSGSPGFTGPTCTAVTGYSLPFGMRLVQAILTRCPRRTSIVGPGTVPLYPHIRVGGSCACSRTQVGVSAISVSVSTFPLRGRSTGGTVNASVYGTSPPTRAPMSWCSPLIFSVCTAVSVKVLPP